MERIIKHLFASIISLFIFMPSVCATNGELSLSTLITTQNINFENCTKVFNTDNVSLFYLTVAAINANRFQIDEIQSKSGYILFTAVNKQFLASISNVNTNQGMLRITPADGIYYFQPGIVLNIFKYIDLNEGKKPENLGVF
ncbi:MAG: hypothetical protein E7Z87_04465 [Cyanobacteria bacterium SIG26]|nr:hypothetical protein [Cyanobacteria bacterium SIG26]